MGIRFTAGEMAQLHGVSKQTLIFYDKAGVFSPALRDESNGYRYYAPEQLEMLDHILMLKESGMSLKEIRDFLALPKPDGALDALRCQRAVLMARQKQLAAASERLDRKIARLEGLQNCHGHGVTFVELPPQPMATLAVPAPGAPMDADLALKRLLRQVMDAHMPFDYQMGTRVGLDAMTDDAWTRVCEVFFPLAKPCRAAGCRIRPAGRFARALHTGAYANVGQTYSQMLSAIAAEGLHASDASYETCLLDSMLVRSAAEYLTEVLIPVA